MVARSDHVARLLGLLAAERRVSASTQNQAKSALLFLYKHVLDVELPWLAEVVAAKVRRSLPVVLAAREVSALVAELEGGKDRVTVLPDTLVDPLRRHRTG